MKAKIKKDIWVCCKCGSPVIVRKHFGKWIKFFNRIRKYMKIGNRGFWCKKCRSFVFAKKKGKAFRQDLVDMLDELNDGEALRAVIEGKRAIKAGAKGISFKENKNK